MIVGRNSHNKNTPRANRAIPRPKPRTLFENDVTKERTIPIIIVVTVRTGTTFPSPFIHASTQPRKFEVKVETFAVLNVFPVFWAL